MKKQLTLINAEYQKNTFMQNFYNIKNYVDDHSLRELVFEADSFYVTNKDANYRIYREARLKELRQNKRYLDILFHLFIRKVKPISHHIITAKGWDISERYFTGKAFYYQFELFSLNNSLDMELSGIANLAIKDLKENFLKYEELFHKLGDDKSRIVLNAILMARLSRNPMHYFAINDHPEEKEYFDKELISCSGEEIFVDCGGYIGDTVLDYMAINKGKYKKIYVYEPSSKNYMKATRNLAKFKNIVFRQMGVSDISRIASFSDTENPSALITDNGNTSVQLITLDEDISERITYIKMDIEGQELEALKGAVNHISRDNPKLSISLYHKVDDLWRIPQYVSQVNSDYRLFIRHYENCHAGTILYAI